MKGENSMQNRFRGGGLWIRTQSTSIFEWPLQLYIHHFKSIVPICFGSVSLSYSSAIYDPVVCPIQSTCDAHGGRTQMTRLPIHRCELDVPTALITLVSFFVRSLSSRSQLIEQILVMEV